MKKIVPFSKQLEFKKEVHEIVSISIDHNLKKLENLVKGEFDISGTYKINELSLNTDPFTFKVPFDINFDKKYDISNCNIEIDNFYYELEENKLIVNIEVLVDDIEEIEELAEREVNEIELPTELPFELPIDSEELYKTYKVYIVKEEDTIESITTKYSVTKEELSNYNELLELKIGDKLIIPSNERNS